MAVVNSNLPSTSLTINLVSYNMHGFNQGANTLASFCNDGSLNMQLVFVQESWLSNANINKINSFSNNYTAFGISAMESALGQSVLRGRPWGGVSILVKSDLVKHIIYSKCTERFVCLIIGEYVFINCYFPKISNDSDFAIVQSLFSEIESICAMYPDSKLIIGGDLNVDLRFKSTAAELYLGLMKDLCLVSCHSLFPCDIDYTYCHETLQYYSYIDYFLVSSSMSLDILNFKVLDLADNLSDHNPISVQFKMSLSISGICNNKTNKNSKSVNDQKTLRWDHSYLPQYYECTRSQLQPIYNLLASNVHDNYLNGESHTFVDIDPNVHKELGQHNSVGGVTRCRYCSMDYCEISQACHCDINTKSAKITASVESMYNDIVNALNNAAQLCVPIKKSNFFKYWWDQELDLLKQISIDTHKAWVNANRPSHGIIYHDKRKAKAAYKSEIRCKQMLEKNNITNSLHDALVNKSNGTFWKVWNSKFSNKTKSSPVIDGFNDDEDIANNFANYFSKTCDVNSESKNTRFHETFSSRFNDYLGDSLYDKNAINVRVIEEIIDELSTGKASGLDGLSVEHLKYSHPILISILSMLYNLMLRINFVPNACGIGLTIPIPKTSSNSKLQSPDDFRGITISPILSKVFEKCLLKISMKYLNTSDMQFGFKKNSGCTHAIYTVRSTIEYFNRNNSTVNLCSIDVSKAFDKVNHYALFTKLMDRNVPRHIVLILKCWYDKIVTTVKWNACLSHKVKLVAGVRQGGILSPYLFAVFVDIILVNLRNSKFGCHINTVCYNAIMFADDLILLAISLRDLQAMVGLCVEELDLLDLKVNLKKSMCLRIGKRHNEQISQVVINNQALEWKQEIKYLGVTFVSANSFKCTLQAARQNFFKALNGIFAKIGTKASPAVVLSLVNSYCLPVLLYGTEALSINNKLRNYLDNAYRSVFAKIFCTFNNEVLLQCQFYCGVLPIGYTVDIRALQFYYSLMSTSNFYVKLLFLKMGNDELNQIRKKYELRTDFLYQLKTVMWSRFESNLFQTL